MLAPGVVYALLAAMPDTEVITKDDIVDNVTLGKFLEKTRLSKNLTKGDIGAMIGMTLYGYSKYEHGKIKTIPKDVLSKIAEALSIDVSDLEFKERTVRTKAVIESSVIPTTTIAPSVHSEDITVWLGTSDSTQWVAMAYYNYLKYKQRKS